MLLCRIVDNTLGDILHPQPAPWLYLVNCIGVIIFCYFKKTEQIFRELATLKQPGFFNDNQLDFLNENF
ncbi:hypothetical protein JCM15548_12484 [Geofilum rubicundum JCM 15548]|uniref:Uncharacterized protein n=1 Tax=Geofilum rubicundum JCM 15548 TaxID=1236989 RepID=A0A0E9LYL1_9BACT|nr:hypothetical protein JCM15548_12484 [Geofilum rubicundum JCM 15548]